MQGPASDAGEARREDFEAIAIWLLLQIRNIAYVKLGGKFCVKTGVHLSSYFPEN